LPGTPDVLRTRATRARSLQVIRASLLRSQKHEDEMTGSPSIDSKSTGRAESGKHPEETRQARKTAMRNGDALPDAG